MNARKLLLAAGTALAATLVSAPSAHAQFGVAGGLNFNQFDDIDVGSADATFEQATGFHVGIFLNIGSGPVSVSPGVFYHQVGTFDFPAGEQLELTSIEVPVDVRLRLIPLGTASVYLLAAPVVTFPQTEDFAEAVKDWSLTADVGVGVSVGVPGVGLSLLPEIRYSLGVTDYLSDSFQIGDVTVTPADDTRRMSKLMLRLGVMF